MIRTAKTQNGQVRGIEAADPRITAFKGIPFAAPPTGKNRWRAPQPCQDWEGVRDASRFGPIAVQDTPGIGDNIYCREWHVDPDTPMSEDCLYLNIWTGAQSDEERRPVLVWFFGGALQWGYPSEMEFDGERLARRGIVVVTANYRINVFGFMAHPQLTCQQPDAPANFGSLDQQAALKWTIRNIQAFGGDAGNITIAGQSAGGGSVLSQMSCPANAGLFQRAVVMSGMIRSPYGEGSIGTPRPLWEAEEGGVDFLDFLGVSTLEQARELDAVFIRDKYAEYVKNAPRMGTAVDGRFCVGDPLALFLEGKCADVPVMAGNTVDEFPSFLSAGSRQELAVKARNIFGERAEAFLELAEPEGGGAAGPAEAEKEMGQGIGTACGEPVRCGTVSGLECTIKGVFEARSGGADCYYYQFAPWIPGPDAPGCFHSVDLWFFFETLAKCWRPFIGKHYDLARQMCNYWVNFIKNGDPNGEDADGRKMPLWEPYTRLNPVQMRFTTDGPRPATEPGTPLVRFLSEAVVRDLRQDHFRQEWMQPFWKGQEVWRETFAMTQREGVCAAPFLRKPGEILRVESYSGETLYEPGRDYLVRDDMLILPQGSRIPHTQEERFFHRTQEESEKALERAGICLDFDAVATVDGRYLSLCAIGNPEYVTRWQIAVTYRAQEEWTGYVPRGRMKDLPRLRSRIAEGKPLTILLYGDSISCGWDCSGKYGHKPGQPVWPALLLQKMQEKWQAPIRFHNTSASGMDTQWAIAHVKERVSFCRPDLVILGFGMNDRCDGEEYRDRTRRLVDAIRRDTPQAEFVLIATTLPNPLAATPPMYFSAHQEEYSDGLKALCGEGIVLADVQAVQKEMGKKKRYPDLTGNLLNHPNDFLARVQAQVIAAVLEI